MMSQKLARLIGLLAGVLSGLRLVTAAITAVLICLVVIIFGTCRPVRDSCPVDGTSMCR